MSLRRPNRRTAVLVVVLVAIVFGAGGLVGARLVQSPQEAAARRRPPAPTVLTAPVEFRVLTDALVTRGDVVVGRRVDVTLSGAGSGAGDSRPVVTGVRARKGGTARSGQAVVEVSGRPVVLLQGRVPAYRDLRPGAHGKDIHQLQAALGALGFIDGGDPAGTLGAGTQDAIRLFYASVGYDAPTTGDEEALAAAQDAVRSADRAVDDARRALRRLRRERADPKDPRTHQYAVADAERAVRLAREDLHSAEQHRTTVASTSGPMVPLSEYVFVPELPATVAELDVSVGSDGDGKALSLDLGTPRVLVKADPAQRDLLHVGLPVSVHVDALDKDLRGTIGRIGPESDDGSGGLMNPVSITCPDLPRSAVGTNVRVTARTASTQHKVLVVPLTAAMSSADGRTSVLVLTRQGQHRVAIRPGLSATGYLEVEPEAGGRLSPGDRVVLGAG